MDVFQDEAAEFSVEDAERVVREAIKSALHDNAYNPRKVNEWTNLIVTSCLKSLQELGKRCSHLLLPDAIQANHSSTSSRV